MQLCAVWFVIQTVHIYTLWYIVVTDMYMLMAWGPVLVRQCVVEWRVRTAVCR